MENDRLKELLAICELAESDLCWDENPSGEAKARVVAMARTALPDALKALVLCRAAIIEQRAALVSAHNNGGLGPFETCSKTICRRARREHDEALAAIAQVGEGGEDE